MKTAATDQKIQIEALQSWEVSKACNGMIFRKQKTSSLGMPKLLQAFMLVPVTYINFTPLYRFMVFKAEQECKSGRTKAPMFSTYLVLSCWQRIPTCSQSRNT